MSRARDPRIDGDGQPFALALPAPLRRTALVMRLHNPAPGLRTSPATHPNRRHGGARIQSGEPRISSYIGLGSAECAWPPRGSHPHGVLRGTTLLAARKGPAGFCNLIRRHYGRPYFARLRGQVFQPSRSGRFTLKELHPRFSRKRPGSPSAAWFSS